MKAGHLAGYVGTLIAIFPTHEHHLEKERRMGTITTADGAEIFTRTGEPVSPSCSATAGPCRPMTGTRR